jgi:hypothetical protein
MHLITPSKHISTRGKISLWVLLRMPWMLLCFGLYWRVTRRRFKHDRTRFKRDRTVLKLIGKDIGTKPLTQGVNGTAQIVRIRRFWITVLE